MVRTNTGTARLVWFQLVRSLVWYGLQIILKRNHRSYQRWLDKIVYKTEMKFWAVLGRQDCEEKKKIPNCHKYAAFWAVFFIFLWAKENLKFFKKYCSVSTEKLHKRSINKKS